MKNLFFSLSVLFVLGTGSVGLALPPQSTVPHVDLDRYMGRWYVIANIPTMFEKGAYNATETYTWNAGAQRIDIDFHYNQDSFTGPIKSVPQKGFIYNTDSNAEWRVQPFWPLKFAYLIVDLAPDYSTVIVGVPDRKNVWIMARESQISDSLYQELVSKVESFGYDLAQLQKVPQQ